MMLLPIVAEQSGQSAENMIMSVLSMVIVFAGLAVILMVVKLISATKSNRPAVVSAAQPMPKGVPAPGSLGQLALHTVPDKTAAMIMAIVADELRLPLNELRFISIREV